jgi:hypothetical protein
MIASGVTPGFQGLNGASGAVDGFTYLCWGANGMRDVNMLRPIHRRICQTRSWNYDYISCLVASCCYAILLAKVNVELSLQILMCICNE